MNDAPPESSPPPTSDAPVRYSETAVAVLLAVAAVLTAIVGARAALVGDSGSDTWHKAVREDVAQGAVVVEDFRFVYQQEAPLALQLVEARLRVEELRRAAGRRSGEAPRLLRAEAAAQAKIVDLIRPASKLARDPKYARRDGSYDVISRLADQRGENAKTVRLTPDRTEARGSERSEESALLVAAAIPLAIAFLFGALAEGFERWRRRLVPAGWAFVGIGLLLAAVVEVTH